MARFLAHNTVVILLFLLSAAVVSTTGGAAVRTKGTPVESVIGLLEKLSSQIKKEGKEEAASYDKFACFCKEQADEKFYVITKAKKKIARLEAEIEQLDGEIKSLEAEEAEASKEKEANDEEIEKKKEERQKELEEFQKMDANLREIITALKDAIRALDESKAETVGNAKLNLLREVFVSRASPTRQAQFLQLIKGTKKQAPAAAAYEYKSNDVIAMLKELLKDFTGDKREGVSEEQRNKHDSDMTVNGLENLNEGLVELLEKNREIQGAKNDEMKTKDQDKQETATNLGYDQDFLDELTEQCEGKAGEFDQRSKTRADELKAIAGALELLKGTVQGKYQANKKLVGLVAQHVAARSHEKGHWVWVADATDKKVSNEKENMPAWLSVEEVAQDDEEQSQREDNAVDDEHADDTDDDDSDDDSDSAEDDADYSFLQRRKKGRAPARHARSKKALRFLAAKADGLNSPTLSALVMKLKQGENADHFVKVRGLILDLVKRLEEDAANEADQKQFCDESLEKAIKSRDEQQQAIEKENGEITTGEAKIHKLDGEIAGVFQDIADLNKAKKEAEELRQEEKHENKYTVEETKAGLGAVTQAIEILKGFYENAFVQKKRRYDPFRAEGAGADGKTVGDMAPDTFQGEYQGNQAASKGIIVMLEVIKSDFERTIKTTEDTEEAAEAKHETFLKDTDADIDSKNEEKDTKEGEKKDEKADLVNNKDELVDAKDQKQNALEELEKLKPACIDTGLSWEERTKKREEEIEALKEALRILDTAFD